MRRVENCCGYCLILKCNKLRKTEPCLIFPPRCALLLLSLYMHNGWGNNSSRARTLTLCNGTCYLMVCLFAEKENVERENKSLYVAGVLLQHAE